MLFAGSNAAWAHPVLFRRMEAAKAANPDLKIIAVDPRKTDTTAFADLHLPIQPGSDVVLYSAMLHVLLWEGLTDSTFIADHTTGFEAVRDAVRSITPAFAAQICGVPEADIITAARWFGKAKAPLSLWCQGLNQSSHGTANGAALIHLHLATGKIGQPGMGPFSLTGQPNAMGGREVGAMANLLSAHRDLSNPEDRAEMARFWDVPVIPANPGLTATELFDAVGEGRIKALWIACTNPAHSLPDQTKVQAALASCDFVVVQEAFADTETVAFADLLLPARTWGEKEGSVTNSERRISHLSAAVAAPGEALPDWEIASRFGLALASALGRAVEGERLFPYSRPADIFLEHVASTRGRDMDISGLSYDVLDFHGPQQWPMPVGMERGQTRLYQDRHFAFSDGRARFYGGAYPLAALTAERTDARFPLALNTGRLRDQWHGMSRTGRSTRLMAHADRPVLSMNPGDLARRSLVAGSLIKVSSRKSSAIWEVCSDDTVALGQVYIPMHWGGNSLASAGVNALLPIAIDPVSRQPELKHAAVKVEAIEEPAYRVVLFRAASEISDERGSEEQVLIWRQRLSQVLKQLPDAPDWQALTLAGHDAPMVALELAWLIKPAAADAMLNELLAAVDLGPDDGQIYDDRRRGIYKQTEFATVKDKNCEGKSCLVGLLLAGEALAASWLKQAMIQQQAAESFQRWVFAPLANAPQGSVSSDRTVCSCMNVGEQAIKAEIASGADLLSLQTKLRCGTACGSCVPQLKKMLQAK
jgi:assimilatory nitrate reductase catalytic subunit